MRNHTGFFINVKKRLPQYTPDVIAWAVPIRDSENKVNCSVTLSGPTYRLNNLDQNQAI